MWLLAACGSAFFAGVTAILSKVGIKKVNSDLATCIRTFIVLIFAWLVTAVTGGLSDMSALTSRALIFLMLSGLSTGLSWLFYFRAIQIGEVSKVSAIDKLSTPMTIILAFVFLGEKAGSLAVLAIILIICGGLLLADINLHGFKGGTWILYSFLSAVFAALTAILGKIGISEINSNLGTAIRTIFVLICSLLIVFSQGRQKELRNISKKSYLFLILSGTATGASWLCYYYALHFGDASLVVPIDKLSILVTVIFSCFILKEKIKLTAWIGLALMIAGTMLLLM